MRKTGPIKTIIGLTGGIATGKSTVAFLFAKLGAKVICCDEIAHRALWKNTLTYKQIVECFGKTILDSNQRINKRKLAEIIFKNKNKRVVLENIIHPFVFKKLASYIRKATGVLILEIPLLFETGYEKHVDYTVLVNCSKEEQIKRLMLRDDLSKENAIKRINTQLSMAIKKKKADFIIENADVKKTVEQTKKTWRQFEITTKKQ